MNEWLPIANAPTNGTEMFVVRGFNVSNEFTGNRPYTTDPWCVWRDGNGGFVRWPHKFPPTHFMSLPAPPNECAEMVEHGCHVDFPNEIYPECVINSVHKHECSLATGLASKESCAHWRPIK